MDYNDFLKINDDLLYQHFCNLEDLLDKQPDNKTNYTKLQTMRIKEYNLLIYQQTINTLIGALEQVLGSKQDAKNFLTSIINASKKATDDIITKYQNEKKKGSA